MSSCGVVASLWRYPVKSMAGEQIDASDVSAAGLAGDRAYALIDVESGKLVSAKQSKKWPGILDYRAAFAGEVAGGAVPAVRITNPDGDTFGSDQEDGARRLSEALGREVRIEASLPEGTTVEYFADPFDDSGEPIEFPPATASPEGTFFDFSPVHLLTTASLDRLSEAYPEGRFTIDRFRPNIVVDSPEAAGFVENDWIGRTVAIGEVRLQVVEPTPRCSMTTLAQGDLPYDPQVLRTVAQHNQVRFSPFDGDAPSVGVYASVIAGGSIRAGDTVELLD